MSEARCGEGLGSGKDMERMKVHVVDSITNEVDDVLRAVVNQAPSQDFGVSSQSPGKQTTWKTQASPCS